MNLISLNLVYYKRSPPDSIRTDVRACARRAVCYCRNAVGAGLLICSSFSHNHAQGSILFNNRGLTDPATGVRYDARVTLPDGTGAAGDAFTAGLFLVEGASLSLLGTTRFRSTSAQAAGFFLPEPGIIYVPGIPSGSSATFRVRVWETSAGSYDDAVARRMLHGEFQTDQPNNNLFIPALGPPPFGPISHPDLSGIHPLTLQVPEPTMGMLLIFGGTIWFVLRKRYHAEVDVTSE